VVFVLATTDPQKVSDTIRSRTQHLQFRLLPAKDLEEHVRWVVADAKLDVTPEAIRQVVSQGGGSARDTLSVLELVAASGGQAEESVQPEDIIEALIANDPGSVLTHVATAMQRGHDPKAFTELVVRFLREMFLSAMAPQLVQLSEEHAKVAADLTARYGIASVVRAIEILGEALLEIRRAPDARLVLEVTLVRLAGGALANDTASLLARIERLESGTARPRDVTGPIPRPRLSSTTTGASAVTPTRRSAPTHSTPSGSPVPSARSSNSESKKPDSRSTAPAVEPTDDLVGAWPQVIRTLKATVRALYSAVDVIGVEDDTFIVAAPSEMHKKKCLELQDAVVVALTGVAGRPIALEIRVAPDQPSRAPSSRPVGSTKSTKAPTMPVADEYEDEHSPVESVVGQIAKQFPGARIVDSPPS
jgi:DNA polymerase-3 subunit gamma/tau